jgi:SH3 domain-containing YSC84-like protein 1
MDVSTGEQTSHMAGLYHSLTIERKSPCLKRSSSSCSSGWWASSRPTRSGVSSTSSSGCSDCHRAAPGHSGPKSAPGRYLAIALCFVLGSAALDAANQEQDRLENCGVVMQEILDVPDNIPQELLEKAECVIVIPSMTKVAVGIGGSVGLQLGGESTDVVLLVMNTRGVDALLSSKVKLGANASAAAGPKSRTVEASTDASLRAEILSYSRSRGLFAGVSLEGTSLRPDDDASEQVYGRKMTARNIVTGKGISVPASGRHFVDVLEKNARTTNRRKRRADDGRQRRCVVQGSVFSRDRKAWAGAVHVQCGREARPEVNS